MNLDMTHVGDMCSWSAHSLVKADGKTLRHVVGASTPPCGQLGVHCFHTPAILTVKTRFSHTTILPVWPFSRFQLLCLLETTRSRCSRKTEFSALVGLLPRLSVIGEPSACLRKANCLCFCTLGLTRVMVFSLPGPSLTYWHFMILHYPVTC